MLWRVDRVFVPFPDRRRHAVFAGFVAAPTISAAWSKAHVWFAEYGTILVRPASYQRTTSPQPLREIEMLMGSDDGTEVANGTVPFVPASDAFSDT